MPAVTAGNLAEPTYAVQVIYTSIIDSATSVCNASNIENHETGFALYPNPSTGDFTIEVNSEKIESVLIYSTIGQCVYQKDNVNLNSLLVQPDRLSKGIYFVEIKTETHSLVERLMIR